MSKDDDARLANIYTASPPYLRYPERNNLSWMLSVGYNKTPRHRYIRDALLRACASWTNQFPVTVSLLCYRSHP